MAACRRGVIISILLALLAVALPRSAAKELRGIDPAYKLRYGGRGGKFTCFDGSKVIPASQINDAFCDCLDGSDEPGTSACPNGKFYCANIGSEPLRLNSSFVDDGVCDCCDGSDEPQGRCKNGCKEAGAAALAALQAELKAVESGYATRNRYIKAAEGLRRDWSDRLKQIEEEFSPSETKSQTLASERDRLEKQVQALEAKRTKMEAALAPPAVQPADTTGEEQQQQEPQVEDAVDPDFDIDEAVDSTEDDQETAEQESSEDIAKRVASQWIPGATKEEHQQEEAEEAIESDEGDVYEPSPDALASMQAAEEAPAPVDAEELLELDLGLIGRLKSWVAEMVAKVSGKPADAAELQRLRATVDAMRSRLEAARSAYETASSAMYELKYERERLETKINRSYGPDDVYAQLADRCVEAHIDKYVYKVCPFNQAEQLEDGHGPKLGNWKGFDASGEHMIFDGGDTCWQGPNRSITVRIRCGVTETLTKVAEPSRCEYTAEMTTPAACSEEQVKELRAAVAAKQALIDAAAKDEL